MSIVRYLKSLSLEKETIMNESLLNFELGPTTCIALQLYTLPDYVTEKQEKVISIFLISIQNIRI